MTHYTQTKKPKWLIRTYQGIIGKPTDVVYSDKEALTLISKLMKSKEKIEIIRYS